MMMKLKHTNCCHLRETHCFSNTEFRIQSAAKTTKYFDLMVMRFKQLTSIARLGCVLDLENVAY